jgi:hypothetical protein
MKGCLNVCRLSSYNIPPPVWLHRSENKICFSRAKLAWCSLAVFGVCVLTQSIAPLQHKTTKQRGFASSDGLSLASGDLHPRCEPGWLGKSTRHVPEPCVRGLVAKSPRCSRSRWCELVWVCEEDVHDTFHCGRRVYSFMLAINSKV